MDMWQMLDKFRAEVVDSSSTQTLATAAASILHEFNSNQAPLHRGSVKGRSKNLPRNRVEEHLQLHRDYFHRTDPVLMQGKAPRVSYEVNKNEYDKPYYLADGIYPDWATLVKSVRNPNSEKTRRFAKMQESCKKDVERGFGMLQTRWAIVCNPARTWSLKTMHEVMTSCVIMHNMIVENERPDGRNENHLEFHGELVAPIPGTLSWEDYLHMNVEVTNETVCKRLQTDLIEHQWALAGHEDNA
ncbi:hypothetical protein QYE76_045367 [Lolium multiflorum]|uniref:Uncharacterized protein n=1 Tax=Lolium multiflorum TaxID=4521 RepID=A0AAD8TKB7_LOLMU|nr:hypothetical protein QYE76_045367 [Lolium multiflorum]